MTEGEHRLKEDSLGLFESTVMGVAGTAPAFSIAATTGVLIGTVGESAIASLFYSGLIMLGVTLSFLHFNRINAHAGASYAWVGQVFHPILGFFAGWSLLVASAVFMVSGTVPVATATLALIDPGYTQNTPLVTLVAAFWLILIGFIVIKGIKLSSYFQVASTLTEVLILMLITFLAFYLFSADPVQPFHLSQLSLGNFTQDSFATGALTALFFFWGWDVTINLSEETKNAKHTSGLGALIAMFIVLFLFATFVIAVQFAFTRTEIEQAGTNLMTILAAKIFPGPLVYLAIIAIILSTLGTLETNILQFTRTLFATGRDGVLNPKYAKLHKSWKTPWQATFLILFIGLALLFFSSFIPTVDQIISISVKAIGLQVAFYYGLTGFACAWHFRHEAKKHPFDFISLFLWPLASSLFMVYIFYFSMINFDVSTNIIGIGGILIGILPYLWNKKRNAVKRD